MIKLCYFLTNNLKLELVHGFSTIINLLTNCFYLNFNLRFYA